MRTFVLTALAVVFGAGMLLAGEGKIEWEKDYEKGMAKAKETGKPVMLYFTADW